MRHNSNQPVTVDNECNIRINALNISLSLLNYTFSWLSSLLNTAFIFFYLYLPAQAFYPFKRVQLRTDLNVKIGNCKILVVFRKTLFPNGVENLKVWKVSTIFFVHSTSISFIRVEMNKKLLTILALFDFAKA